MAGRSATGDGSRPHAAGTARTHCCTFLEGAHLKTVLQGRSGPRCSDDRDRATFLDVALVFVVRRSMAGTGQGLDRAQPRTIGWRDRAKGSVTLLGPLRLESNHEK